MGDGKVEDGKVEDTKQEKGYGGDQVDADLVVLEGDALPVDSLFLVLLLFLLEDELVKVELEGLVGVIDAELLKAVDRKILKAKNVKDSHKGQGLVLANCAVDFAQDPREHSSVEG